MPARTAITSRDVTAELAQLTRALKASHPRCPPSRAQAVGEFDVDHARGLSGT
jgi:hypothetical protein